MSTYELNYELGFTVTYNDGPTAINISGNNLSGIISITSGSTAMVYLINNNSTNIYYFPFEGVGLLAPTTYNASVYNTGITDGNYLTGIAYGGPSNENNIIYVVDGYGNLYNIILKNLIPWTLQMLTPLPTSVNFETWIISCSPGDNYNTIVLAGNDNLYYYTPVLIFQPYLILYITGDYQSYNTWRGIGFFGADLCTISSFIDNNSTDIFVGPIVVDYLQDNIPYLAVYNPTLYQGVSNSQITQSFASYNNIIYYCNGSLGYPNNDLICNIISTGSTSYSSTIMTINNNPGLGPYYTIGTVSDNTFPDGIILLGNNKNDLNYIWAFSVSSYSYAPQPTSSETTFALVSPSQNITYESNVRPLTQSSKLRYNRYYKYRTS